MIVLGFVYNYGDSIYVVQIIYWHEGKMFLGVEESASSSGSSKWWLWGCVYNTQGSRTRDPYSNKL